MLLYLSEAAQAAREIAGKRLEPIAAAAGVSTNAIRAFERGETWPKDIDRTMNAYATETDLPNALPLWRIAFELWESYEWAEDERDRDQAATSRVLRLIRDRAAKMREEAQRGPDEGLDAMGSQ